MSKVDELAEIMKQLALASAGMPKDACPDHSILTNALEAAIDERINKQNPYDMPVLVELIETNHQRLNNINKQKG